MKTITAIREVEGHKLNSESWGGYDGFIVETDDGDPIKLLISNGQSCCESWGYFMSEDDVQSFVGASLRNVTLTNTALKTEQAPDVYDGDVMFVNLETDRGTLQFVAYNSHNGYYGHTAMLINGNARHSRCL